MKVIGIDNVTAEERKKIEAALSDKTVEDFKNGIQNYAWILHWVEPDELKINDITFDGIVLEDEKECYVFDVIASSESEMSEGTTAYEDYKAYLYNNEVEVQVVTTFYWESESGKCEKQFAEKAVTHKDYIELKD